LINYRKKSEKHLFYEALAKRLPQNHYYWETVQKTLRKESGGYAGELRVDRELEETQLFHEYKVLRNIVVGNPSSYCQIDTLVIHHNFILILEVKNIPGVLTYDVDTHQLTRRRDNGPIEGMGNPEAQLKRCERFINKFLSIHQLSIPVHGMIIFSNPASILAKPFPNCSAIHVSGLYQAMDKLHQLYAENHNPPKFDPRKIQQLFERHELGFPPRRPTHIPTNVFTELINGVLCPICEKNKLNYKSKYWRCSICKFKSEDAHLKALQEYSILYSEEITTVEWKNFCGLNSLATTKRVLDESHLVKIGSKKNRKWVIPNVHF